MGERVFQQATTLGVFSLLFQTIIHPFPSVYQEMTCCGLHHPIPNQVRGWNSHKLLWVAQAGLELIIFVSQSPDDCDYMRLLLPHQIPNEV